VQYCLLGVLYFDVIYSTFLWWSTHTTESRGLIRSESITLAPPQVCVEKVRANPGPLTGRAAVYGMAQMIPDRKGHQLITTPSADLSLQHTSDNQGRSVS
jgi:hypothetical protein